MTKKHSGVSAKRKQTEHPATQDSWGSGIERTAAGIALIFCLTLIAYAPAFHGQMLVEDPVHVTPAALQSFQGLWDIWSDLKATPHYRPVLHTAFWIENRLWSDSVAGYHIINILLHCISATLVVLIVRRLRIAGAWLAGFIYALHPVCTQTVAWISGQAGALSAVFYLAAVLAYLSYDANRNKSVYFWGLGFFAFASLTQPATATLPIILVILLWWMHRRIDWTKHLQPLAPWLALGIFAGLLAGLTEKAAHQNPDAILTFIQRCLLAGYTVWFYLAKLFWPAGLSFIYPRFHIDDAAWWQYLVPAAFLALMAALWLLGPRRRGPFLGLVCFVVTLAPVLGILSFSLFPFSNVADYHQYLACLGIIVPVSAGLTIVFQKFIAKKYGSAEPTARKRQLMQAGACGVLLLMLFTLTSKQSRMYTDPEILWQTTIAKNPTSSIAHNNMGAILFQQERVNEAMRYCRTAVSLDPENAEANGNLANALRYQQQFEEAVSFYRKAAALQPDNASFHSSIANTLVETREIAEAVVEYEKALRLDPDDGLLTNNLAWILATCPDGSIRNGKRALELALRGVQLLGQEDPTILGTLAAAYAETGSFEEASSVEEKAYALAQAAGDKDLLDWHQQLIETYKNRAPYRESSLAPQ